MKTKLREVEESDIEDIRELNRESWKEAYKDSIPRQEIEENTGDYPRERLLKKMSDDKLLFLVAEVNGTVVGTINICWSENNTHEFVDVEQNEAQLRAVYLHPDYWNKGIGTKLFEEGLQRIPKNIDILKVESVAENKIGRNFYDKLGFEATDKGEIDLFGDYYSTIIQRKELN